MVLSLSDWNQNVRLGFCRGPTMKGERYILHPLAVIQSLTGFASDDPLPQFWPLFKICIVSAIAICVLKIVRDLKR